MRDPGRSPPTPLLSLQATSRASHHWVLSSAGLWKSPAGASHIQETHPFLPPATLRPFRCGRLEVYSLYTGALPAPGGKTQGVQFCLCRGDRSYKLTKTGHNYHEHSSFQQFKKGVLSSHLYILHLGQPRSTYIWSTHKSNSQNSFLLLL